MPIVQTFFLACTAMLAFAGNSLLCRVALKQTGIDAGSFTAVRLISGAAMLLLVVKLSQNKAGHRGSWLSAFALFVYAAGFSFAYISLPAATGALLLFGAVQSTMLGHAVWKGERLHKLQMLGLVIAAGGLVGMFLPGLSVPPLSGALLMLGAGIAWGIYSLRGRGKGDPTKVSAGNFLRAVPFALVLGVLTIDHASLNNAGIACAILSGAFTSGLGYAIWYRVLPALKATHAATIQLSVPVITALGGVVFLDESITLRLILASIAMLGGIALTILVKSKS
jgi:drug/metabolite transporter (DMT)-like permease